MSKKYVIEMKSEYEDTIRGIMVLGARDSNLYMDALAVEDMEELNSDYINEHYGELQDTAYQRGLEDAWEAARKIVVDTDNGGIALGTLGEIFGTRAYSCIMRDNTAQEAIAKLKAYEDKQKDSIEVGDEVIASCGKAVVTAINNNFVYYLYSGGDCGANEVGHLTKTGKHYDIQSILEALRK